MKKDFASRRIREEYEVIFPRCQHPDNRTNQEFLQALKKKSLQLGKWRPMNRRGPNQRPVICLTTGQEFKGMMEAEKKLNLFRGSVGMNIRGKVEAVKGLKFQYV